jgi:hypothetical protein
MIADDLFWAKVDKTGECWLWTAVLNEHGYGILRRWNFNGNGPRNYLAHRYSLMLLGIEPGELHVDHICHTPACVRPEHLRVVTNKQNHEHLRGANINSTSGIRGVHWDSNRKKWRGSVKHNYREYSKRFDTKEQAAEWARDMRNRLFTHNDADRVA